MSSNTPDQSRPLSRVLADLFGLLLVLAGLTGIAYSAFQLNEWAGWIVVSVYGIGLGLGVGTDRSG